MLFEELEQQRADLDRHRENAARLAQAFAKFESTGQGSIEFDRRCTFDLTFIEQPYITYGCEIDLEELADLLGTGVADTPPLPMASGYVTDWDTDERGFYTGCWCAVSVHYAWNSATGDTPELEQAQLELLRVAKVYMRHHFTFTGMAMKDIPIDVRY